MKDDFFKFPSTPHLGVMHGVDVRDDKVLSDSGRNEFLQHDLVVEEKVDGANLGISFDSGGNLRAQNRGAYIYLPEPGQWRKLSDWLEPRIDVLFEYLSDSYILFGEWCYAQHSVFYDRLPDWFLGFDIYDKQSAHFFSSERRDVLFKAMSIAQVPALARGHFTYPEIQNLLAKSKLGDQPAEGVYLRIDQGDWLAQRAKLVRPAFIQAVDQHWSRSAIKPNRLSLEAYG
ncbi:MAG: RNA ligase family protein [Pseudodesulfovibrio sp.]|uniref:RNA ligase family protein n=1 Tax=Pseudodesulfovibrio sp. TaxID=2035812 RepID=UPI003D12A38E